MSKYKYERECGVSIRVVLFGRPCSLAGNLVCQFNCLEMEFALHHRPTDKLDVIVQLIAFEWNLHAELIIQVTLLNWKRINSLSAQISERNCFKQFISDIYLEIVSEIERKHGK